MTEKCTALSNTILYLKSLLLLKYYDILGEQIRTFLYTPNDSYSKGWFEIGPR